MSLSYGTLKGRRMLWEGVTVCRVRKNLLGMNLFLFFPTYFNLGNVEGVKQNSQYSTHWSNSALGFCL